MKTGHFVLSREIFDHPIVGIANPQRFAAWCWMLSEARWKAGRVKGVDLERGQFCHSVRFMAEAVGMSKSAFDRFLTRLKTGTAGEPMIETRTGTGRLIVTICNYDKYQDAAGQTGTVSGTPTGTGSGTRAGHERDKREKGETREEGYIDSSLRSESNARLDLEEPKAQPKRTPRMILAEVAGDEMAAAFIDYRRKSRKPVTDVAATRLASSLTKIAAAGHSAADALGLAIERGWQSVSLDWYLNATKATRLNGSGGHEKTFAQRMIDKHLTDAERAALRGPGR